MSGPEFAPSIEDGISVEESEVTIPGVSVTKTRVESGPTTSIETNAAAFLAANDSTIASVSTRTGNGRGSLTVEYTRNTILLDELGEQEEVQELISVDSIRDLKQAPYFAITESPAEVNLNAMTLPEILEVDAAIDNREAVGASWNNGQKVYYGHKLRGFENYLETVYEFRSSKQVTSQKLLNASVDNPNTKQDLPQLSSTMKRLIDSLPAGEWMKKPTSIISSGDRGWTVSQVYQWAPQLSVIYGGSFTGIDPTAP